MKFLYAFIDTDDHAKELIEKEVEAIFNRIVPGGLLMFHDFNNQFIGPRQVYDSTIATGKYEAVPIDWQWVESFKKANNIDETGNNSWHMPGNDSPNFVGCCRRK